MVKPQFEVGRERVGKGGVVRSADDRRAALVAVGEFARSELGLSVLGFASSGLPGPGGNRETFVWLAEAGRAGRGWRTSRRPREGRSRREDGHRVHAQARPR